MPETASSPLSEAQLAARIAELRDLRRCPACLTPLSSLVCANCGLELDDPLAHELAAASARAAGALEERAALLGRMRDAAAARRSAAAAPSEPAPTTAPATAPAVPPAPAAQTAEGNETHAAPAVAPVAPAATPDAGADADVRAAQERPRRSSVQVVLVVIGISLLATFAVFGLVYAFINYGVVARSLIVGGVTVAALVTASLLRRRGLTATGEGVAALGAFLVLLDAWAIRENDFFGLQSTDELLYWGATLLIAAAVFAGWGRLSRLRLPTTAGHALIVPGAGLLTGGLVDVDDGALTAYLAAIVAAIAGLLHRVLTPRDSPGRPARPALPERIVVVTSALGALVVAFVIAPFVLDEPGNDIAGLVALLAVAGVAATHVGASLTVPDARGGTRALAAVSAGIGTIALLAAPLSLAARLDSPELAVSVPLACAALLALVAEALRPRLSPRLRTTVDTAGITAAVLGGIAAVAALLVAGIPTFGMLALLAEPRTAEFATQVPEADAVVTAALLGLVAVLVTATAIWALGRRLASRGTVVLGAAMLLAVIAAPHLRGFGITLLLWGAIAVGGVAVLLARRRRPSGAHVPVALGAGLAALLGYGVSWAGTTAWITASVVLVVLLIASRLLTARPLPRILPDLAALGVTAVLVGSLVDEYVPSGLPESAAIVLALTLVGVAAIALGTVPRILADVERRTGFWAGSALALGAVGAGLVMRMGAAPDPGTAVNLALAPIALVAAWIAWNSVPSTRAFAPERSAAALGLAPILGIGIVALAEAARVDPAVHPFLLAATALLVGIGGLVRSALGRIGIDRMLGDIGAAAVALVAVGLSFTGQDTEPWTALLPAAVLALVTAVSRDGLVESASPRKHLGWLGIGLGTVALWTRLADGGVDAVEAYTLPLAAALLLVSALVHWRAPRPEAAQPPPSVPYLVGAALLVAIVPSAALVEASAPARSLAVGFGILALLALGLVAGAESSRLGARADRLVCDVVAVAALVAMLAAIIARDEPGTEALAIAAVAVLTALHVLIALVPPATGGTALSWAALAAAALGGFALTVRGIADPVEWVTVPIAAALLVRGTIRMRRDPARGSWTQLAPGVATLLLPSLLAAYVDDPLWRIVAVGVVSLAALVVGVTLRLQAPFVLGAIVLGWHLVTQLWTQLQLVYEALPWWLWLGIAGVLVIVIAARYEQRLNNLKSIVRRVAELR